MLHESIGYEQLSIGECDIEVANLKAQKALTVFKFVPIHVPGDSPNKCFMLLIASAIVPWAFIPAHFGGLL